MRDVEVDADVAWRGIREDLRDALYAAPPPLPAAAVAMDGVDADGAPIPSPPLGDAVAPVKKKATLPRFGGCPDESALPRVSSRLALAERASRESLALADGAPPLLVDSVLRLLRLVRPLSFAQ